AGAELALGKPLEQRRVIQVAVAFLDELPEHLGNDLERRNGRTRLARGVEHYPRVLGMQPRAEPGFERTVEHPPPVDLQDLRAGEPAEQRLANLRGVGAGTLRQ